MAPSVRVLDVDTYRAVRTIPAGTFPVGRTGPFPLEGQWSRFVLRARSLSFNPALVLALVRPWVRKPGRAHAGSRDDVARPRSSPCHGRARCPHLGKSGQQEESVCQQVPRQGPREGFDDHRNGLECTVLGGHRADARVTTDPHNRSEVGRIDCGLGTHRGRHQHRREDGDGTQLAPVENGTGSS